MSDGVIVTLGELIALRRYVQGVRYQTEGRALRAGHQRSTFRGRGMELAEVRHYQAGDEIRHMEWRVTARTGKPHIKLYQEERERPVVILADFNPSMYFGTHQAFKSVVAARLAALIAWVVVRQGDRVGGLIFSDTQHREFSPRARESGVLPFLAALSDYTKAHRLPVAATTGGALNHALLRLRRVAKPGSLVVLISDCYQFNADSEQQLSRLRLQNDILVYHVCDPLELAPPSPQQYAVSDGQHALLFDTTQAAVAQAYQLHCDERIAQLRAQCRKRSIQYEQVTADSNLPLLLHQTFPRRTNG